MLIVLLRAIILFAVLLVVIRLMGKRQIGEMEPFELVITLVISELACIPVADRSIPITFGIVAILSMFAIHQILLLLSKNSKMQQFVSGKPVMVYDTVGINIQALQALNMQVSDLLQSLRATGHFSLEEITFGVLETSGQLSVITNKQLEKDQQYLQVPIIMNGKWDEDDIAFNHIDKSRILQLLKFYRSKMNNVILLSIDETNRMTLQIKNRRIIFETVRGGKLIP